ncbi:hypothetical protein T552_01776 [Pneumocystis carinii B80]|uniref:Uncharacterized protein n=1 Tax=Pneumocystis carinii (strain B80) TaxID=1408658 RepID=A0A0W4ZJK6_PNEC8|nr:hypothetical protein T552_01776 [Pneumocystis carinii B80]KTW28517.1 hypothetical protein T552_01776 [Pneumocystis carinii B80]
MTQNVLFEEEIAKIRSQNGSINSRQKLIANLLLGIEETLRNENSQGNITGYFASLLVLLEESLSNTNNSEVIYSILYLLDLVVRFISAALIRSKYDRISSLLSSVLTCSGMSSSTLRYTISCIQNVLIVQENSTWTSPNNNIKPIFSCLLILSMDSRPKIRKRSQEAISKILAHPPPSPLIIHPILDFSLRETFNILKKSLLEVKEGVGYKNKKNDYSKVIYSFQLLKTIVDAGGCPASKSEVLCSILAEILETKDVYLIMIAFDVFLVIFKKSIFEPERLYGILELILRKKPSEKDIMLLPLWFSVIATGFESYYQSEPYATFKFLPQLFTNIFPFLKSDSFEIRISCSEILVKLIANCIPNDIGQDNEVVVELTKITMQGFTLNYRVAWKEIFKILIAFFKYLPSYIDPYFMDAIKLIGDMRERDEFNEKTEADKVIGFAVKAIGPKTILEILPLNLDQESEKFPKREWMLAVLRSNIYNTELQHFISEFIPLSEKLYQKLLENKDSQGEKDSRIYIEQIWSLFPSYCNFPLDLETAFNQDFVQLLISLFSNQASLRSIICQGLQTLVNKNKDLIDNDYFDEELKYKSPITKSDAERNLAHLQKFISDILSALFNVYSQTQSQFREYILLCIKSWLSITSKEEIINIFNRVIELLSQSLKENLLPNPNKDLTSMSYTMLDLLAVMIVYLPADTSLQLYDIVKSQILNESNHILQKKAYNLFCKMAENLSIKVFLENNIEELQKLFLENVTKIQGSVKKHRFYALYHIINMLLPKDLHFISLILPELIMGTKETNKKARTMAHSLLILIGNRILKEYTIENNEISEMNDNVSDIKANIEGFFTMVSSGLLGNSPNMISATIVSITKLLYEFKDVLNLDFISKLLDTVYVYIISDNHEIAKSVLGFVKMTIASLPTIIIEERLPMLISNLMVWVHKNKGHFKAKVKNIIERMIRRYGYETIEKEIPNEDKKLIINIKKTKERLIRKKIAKENISGNSTLNNKHSNFNYEYETYKNEDSDSDISFLVNDSDSKNKGISKKQTLIKKVDDELIDLLDKNSLINIININSKDQKKTTKKKPISMQFKVDNNGKIIIEDLDKIHLEKLKSNLIKGKDKNLQKQSNKIQSKRKKESDDDDSTDTENITKKCSFSINKRKVKGIRNSKRVKRRFIK